MDNKNTDATKKMGYKMGALFAATIGASSCAIIIALTIRLICWLLF